MHTNEIILSSHVGSVVTEFPDVPNNAQSNESLLHAPLPNKYKDLIDHKDEYVDLTNPHAV